MSTPVTRPFYAHTADFKSGKASPRAFLERCLATIAEREPEVQAFVTLAVDSAKAQADAATARWRSGKPLSPIDGMPVGIKDIIETVDMPTEMGSDYYAGWRPNRDAASVAALREAGAVIIGKTVTTEFATSPPGKTHNPWDIRRTPGGSSSGSAAAAGCGMVPAGLGTQVIGSILRPASYCGCVGFKPSLGAINRGGSHDGLSQSVHGALAASLEDAWIVLREIADRAGGDPGYGGLIGPAAPPSAKKPRRLAVLELAGWETALPAARDAFETAVARVRGAGVEIVRHGDSKLIAEIENALAESMRISRGVNSWETRWPLNSYRAQDASKLSGFSLDRLAEAEAMTLAEYRGLLAERVAIRSLYAKLASECDAAVTLTAPGPAPLGLASTGDPVFVVPGSLLGVPAISLPVMQVESLPLGLQILGFLDEDAPLFAVAGWLNGTLAKA